MVRVDIFFVVSLSKVVYKREKLNTVGCRVNSLNIILINPATRRRKVHKRKIMKSNSVS